MRARLGFAIATSVDPDILLLDEVLATGDAAFREKSKQRVLELVGGAKAIVLVTHDMSWVQEYCTRAMLIEQGRIVMMGSPEEVVARPSRPHGAAPGAGQGEGRLREEARLRTDRPLPPRSSAAADRPQAPTARLALAGAHRDPDRRAQADHRPGGKRPAPVEESAARRPWTCWAMRIPIADGRLIVTRCAITLRATACSRVASRATIEPAKPWVTRTSPANAAPTRAELHADGVGPGRPDPAPLDEHVLGLEGTDPAEPDLDLVGGRLADPAPVEAECAGGRRLRCRPRIIRDGVGVRGGGGCGHRRPR